MRAGLNPDVLFPTRDAASAQLMLVKADCLREAGVIDDAEWAAAVARAEGYLAPRYPTAAMAKVAPPAMRLSA